MEEDYLENFNFLYQKKESQNIRLGLRRIEKALSKIKKPCNKTPAIQIIGTNGKGSITAFLESILSLHSFNIGVTTSPHLFDICERIKINKKQISCNNPFLGIDFLHVHDIANAFKLQN